MPDIRLVIDLTPAGRSDQLVINPEIAYKLSCGCYSLNLLRPPCDDGVMNSQGGCVCLRSRSAPRTLAAILGSSMVFIDGTVVNVALPTCKPV
jgi:hypothetical protein